MPSAFSKEERQRIHERVLKAALAEFCQHGMRRARVEDIARKANIAKGSIYSFFPAKEDMALALLEDFELTERPKLMALIVSAPPAQWLENLVNYIIGPSSKGSVMDLIINQENIAWLSQKLGPERLAEHMSGDAGFLLEFVQTAGAGRGIKQAEAEQWASSLLAAFEYYLKSDLSVRPRAADLLKLLCAFWKEQF